MSLRLSEIDLEDWGESFARKRSSLRPRAVSIDQMKPSWKGNKEYLLAQLIRLIEEFVASGKIRHHAAALQPGRSSAPARHDAKSWQGRPAHVGKHHHREHRDARPCVRHRKAHRFTRRHANLVHAANRANSPSDRTSIFAFTTALGKSADAFQLDHNGNVDAWVKNDHLGFEILYVFKGVVHKYRPDFIIRLKTGNFLVLETKGQDTDQDKTKRKFLDEWVKAVNEHGGFGKWRWAVAMQPGDVAGILAGDGHKM